MAMGSRSVVLYRFRLSAAAVTSTAAHSEKAISTGMHTRIKCRVFFTASRNAWL